MKVFLRFLLVVVIYAIINGILKIIFGSENVFITLVVGIPFSFFAIIYAVSGENDEKK